MVTKKLKKEASEMQSSIGRLLTIIDETLTACASSGPSTPPVFVLKRFSRKTTSTEKPVCRGFRKRTGALFLGSVGGDRGGLSPYMEEIMILQTGQVMLRLTGQ